MTPSASLKFWILQTLPSFFLSTSLPPTRTPNTLLSYIDNMLLPDPTKQPANGGLARSNMYVLQEAACKISHVGINYHELTGLAIVTTSMVLQTNHASGQLEWFHMQVNECSKIVGDQQC